jgi:hypothetical protein
MIYLDKNFLRNILGILSVEQKTVANIENYFLVNRNQFGKGKVIA